MMRKIVDPLAELIAIDLREALEERMLKNEITYLDIQREMQRFWEIRDAYDNSTKG